MPLAFAPCGKEMKISSIIADEKLKLHLQSLGFVSGSLVTTLFDSGGNLIIKIRDSKIALNKGLAMKIMVC